MKHILRQHFSFSFLLFYPLSLAMREEEKLQTQTFVLERQNSTINLCKHFLKPINNCVRVKWQKIALKSQKWKIYDHFGERTRVKRMCVSVSNEFT